MLQTQKDSLFSLFSVSYNQEMINVLNTVLKTMAHDLFLKL